MHDEKLLNLYEVLQDRIIAVNNATEMDNITALNAIAMATMAINDLDNCQDDID